MATQKSTQAAPAASVKQSAPTEENPRATTIMVRGIPGFKIPQGARAVLVFEGNNGELKFQPVAHDASVFNIERDLLKHLNEQPFSVEWLTVLHAYCEQRLAVRAKAQATGCVITPSPVFDWDMTRLAALQAVQS